MSTNLHSRPTSHRNLRALLRVIERAYAQKDIEALDDAYDLAGTLIDYRNEICEYINGLNERLRDGKYKSYFMYTDSDVERMKRALDEIAYGDFNEAMMELEADFRDAEDWQYDEEPRRVSDIFRSEFFTESDRAIWNRLTQEDGVTSDSKGDDKVFVSTTDKIVMLRNYQQKVHGSLVPVIAAVYSNGESGVTVQLAWFDDRIYIAPHVPFHQELDDYFRTISPIGSRADFTAEHLPRHIAGYTLGYVSQSNLFRYEL